MGTDGTNVGHLYVHLPFCSHRCGYCDFVTVVGRGEQHGAYVDALLAELERERGVLADDVATVFVGGGTPTFTEPDALRRVLAALPAAAEVTRRGEPGDRDARARCAAARGRRDEGLARGADVRTPPARGARARCRSGRRPAGRSILFVMPLSTTFRSISSTGSRARSPPISIVILRRLWRSRRSTSPCYELEAKPGTRFTHAWGDELVRQSEAMEGYFERVVETLTSAGYRWYETANFCLAGARAGGRDLRAHHNLGTWHGHDYLGVGIGAVSTLGRQRRRNGASIGRYIGALLERARAAIRRARSSSSMR